MEERDMKTRGLLFMVCVLAVSSLCLGAEGTWKNFTSMKDVRSLARDGSMYWAATSGGLFGWNSTNDSYLRYTNADGLQNINLTALGIDEDTNIWTGTSTGLIHVYSLQNDTWRYVLDISSNTTLTNKQINSFTILGDTIFVCTDFGLSVFRIDEFRFGDTYRQFGALQGNVRASVSSAVIFNDSLWLTVSDGQNINRVAVASTATPNLLPPESWSLLTVGGSSVIPRQLAVFNNKLYAATSSGLYGYAAGNWNVLPRLASRSIVAISPSSTSMAVCTSTEVYTVNSQDSVSQVGSTLPATANSITSDAAGRPVVGSQAGGVLTVDTAWTSHLPNGPNSNSFPSVTVNSDGIVWGASGSSNGQGFYRYNGKNWKSFTSQNSPLPGNDYYRVSTGYNGSVWASSWGQGIVEIPRGSDAIDPSRIYGRNVGLVGLASNPDYIVTSTVACDAQGNTWTAVIRPEDKRHLVMRRADCDTCWDRIPVYLNNVQMIYLLEAGIHKCLAIDTYGNLWAGVREGNLGVISLGNRGATTDSTVAFYLTTVDGLPSNGITDLVVDLDGQVWVGTDRGIAIILDPQNPKRTGGIVSYPQFSGTVVNCIAVDALNQKWVGTTDGVRVYSPDGTQQVATYSVASTNGKLIDNDVKSIAVDSRTGTMYFGTLSGLASLKTLVITPKSSFENLQIHPSLFTIPSDNPVIIGSKDEDSNTLGGLYENWTVKILSIDGQLIRELRSSGEPGLKNAVATWDGMDEQGKFVASGVYIVVAHSEDGNNIAKGKLAVIRK